VVGDRVVRSVMTRHADVCVSEVTGLDPVSGAAVWGPEEFHLWGTEGVGCEQRVAPLAGGGAMTATAPDGRPLVVDAYDGRVLWSGELDQRVEALTADVAVVRDAIHIGSRAGVRPGRPADRGRPLDRVRALRRGRRRSGAGRAG
jgi:outer membrane protein assembly factor BamB